MIPLLIVMGKAYDRYDGLATQADACVYSGKISMMSCYPDEIKDL